MKEIALLIVGFAIAVAAFFGGQMYTGGVETIVKPVNKEYTKTEKYAEYNPKHDRQADPPQVQEKTKVIYRDRIRYVYKRVKRKAEDYRDYERYDWRQRVFQ